MKLKDSGKRRSFETGAVRDVAQDKGRFDLLPYRALTLAAIHMERGARKYSDRNWEKGMPVGEFYNSAMRHFIKWWHGATDEPHLDALIWNILCMAEISERIRAGILPVELDNRPVLGKMTDAEIETHTATLKVPPPEPVKPLLKPQPEVRAPNQEMLTPKGLAKRWGFHKGSVIRMISEGRIGALKIGNRLRIPLDEVLQFEARNQTATPDSLGT